MATRFSQPLYSLQTKRFHFTVVTFTFLHNWVCYLLVLINYEFTTLDGSRNFGLWIPNGAFSGNCPIRSLIGDWERDFKFRLIRKCSP